MLSSVPFGAFVTYTAGNRGVQAADAARNVMYALKNDKIIRNKNQPTSVVLAQILRNALDEDSRHPLHQCLGSTKTLVPVPSSTKKQANSLWVPHRLAAALVNVGLGQACVAALSRAHSVRKSATAKASERPTVSEHYESLTASVPVTGLGDVVLIDDVVTQGSTFLACASRLADAIGNSDRIMCFAMMRSTFADQFQQLVDPCTGIIRLGHNDRGRREP